MRNLILAAAATTLISIPSLAFAAAPAAAPAKAAPHYDCTKKGNMNKAACKGAVATTISTTPTKLDGKPATSTVTTATTAKPVTGKGGGMKACAAQWNALSDTQKGAYKTQAEGMKSKKGGKLSGYNVWTGECMKKK